MLRAFFNTALLIYSTVSSLFAQGTGSSQLFLEKVYLHTDRDYYVTGTDIWFKAYLLNAKNNRLTDNSNNLYVDLIGPKSTIVATRLVRLDQGIGRGDFKLPDSLSSGAYRIRAYTKWMRNFDDQFVFEKTIHLYLVEEQNQLLMDDPGSRKQTRVIIPDSQNIFAPVIDDNVKINFFPEGGSLIEGVAAMLAFKAESVDGAGIPASGKILSQSGEQLALFSCDSSGMGAVLLNGLPFGDYSAVGVYSNGRKFSVELKHPLEKGFSFFTTQSDSLVRITISTNEATIADYNTKTFLLSVKSKGNQVLSATVNLREKQQSVLLSKEDLPAGINEITLYDNNGKPQCERLIFIEDRNEAQSTIVTDKRIYAPKEKVTLTIKISDHNGQPIKTNLSLSVVDAEAVPVNEQDIISYLRLCSELKGNIETPAKYFDKTNVHRLQQLDFLLMTQGWRDFIWKSLEDSIARTTRTAEKGITVSGNVRHIFTKKPIASMNVTLFANKATGQKLFSTETDSAGKFSIPDFVFYGYQFMRLNTRKDDGKKGGYIQVDSIKQDFLPVQKFTQRREGPSDTLFQQKELLAAKVLAKMNLSDTIRLNDIRINGNKKLLESKTFLVTVKEQKEYNNLLHYLMTIAPQFNTKELIIPGEPPVHELILMDGNRPVAVGAAYSDHSPLPKQGSPDMFWGLQMSDILEVKIIKSVSGFSSVNLVLRPGSLDTKDFSEATANLVGYSINRVFYAPKYENGSSGTDLRTTIHWDPDIITDINGEATISFYNAGSKSHIRIIAEGVGENGELIRGIGAYEVK